MGTSFPYLSNLLVKIDPKTKLDPDAKSSSQNRYNVKGFESNFTLIKSRTAPAGVEFTVIYDQVDGFLNSVTNFKALMDEGWLGGSGHGYILEGYEDEAGKPIKVKAKEVKELYREDPKFREVLDSTATELYESKVRLGTRSMAEDPSGLNEEESFNDEVVELTGGILAILTNEEEGIYEKVEEVDGDYQPTGEFYDVDGAELDVEFE